VLVEVLPFTSPCGLPEGLLTALLGVGEGEGDEGELGFPPLPPLLEPPLLEPPSLEPPLLDPPLEPPLLDPPLELEVLPVGGLLPGVGVGEGLVFPTGV